MKKTIKIAAFILVLLSTIVILPSGISKNSSRDGGGRDLVEEFYLQSVKLNDNLKTLEEDIDKFYKKRNDAIEKYNSFTNYNNRYYTDARTNAATITDAGTKQRAIDLINNSEAAYKTKMTDWQSDIAALNANEKEMNDLHTLLKIKVSEAIISKYQQTEMPESSKLKEANSDLSKVIEKLKVLTK